MCMSQCLTSDDKHLIGDGNNTILTNATLTKPKLLEMITSPLAKIGVGKRARKIQTEAWPHH